MAPAKPISRTVKDEVDADRQTNEVGAGSRPTDQKIDTESDRD
jgi:hypothetical protein